MLRLPIIGIVFCCARTASAKNRRCAANERDDLAAAHAQNTGEAPAVILIGARSSSAS